MFNIDLTIDPSGLYFMLSAHCDMYREYSQKQMLNADEDEEELAEVGKKNN